MKHHSFLPSFLGLFLILPAQAGQPQAISSPDQTPEGLEKSDWKSIRAAHEGWKHQFREVEDGWQARNPGQQWTTRFDGRGFSAKPDGASWTWGLEFQSYGFGKTRTEISGTPDVRAEGQRLSYQWNDSVEEWFVNDQRGLEHGFIVRERPQGGQAGEALTFTMSTVGPLRPTVSKDAQTVHFRDALGAPVLNYSGLKVWDAEGTVLASRFERGRGKTFRLVVEESDARYPITIDPIAQQAFLKASNTETSDEFGRSVAVSGDTVVVGATNEGGSGAAYVFMRNGSTWSQQTYLKASNPGADDRFGFSVAVSGDTVVVGAWLEDSSTTGVNSTPNDSATGSGAAYVFVRNGSTWSEQAYLKASNTGANDRFGYSVAVSGDTVVVGANFEASSTTGVNSTPNDSATASGAAYVYARSGSNWSQQAYLKASNAGAFDFFGWSVAVSGDTVVVGAHEEGSSTTGVNSTPNDSATGSGAAYVFVRSGSIWSQQAYLKAANTGAFDNFGNSVAVSGDTVVVGAHEEDSSTTGVNSTPNDGASDSGAAYVFVRNGSTWSQQAYLKASNPGTDDEFGTSVAVSRDTVAVGAWLEDSSTTGVNSTPNDGLTNSGAAYVFVRSGSTWSQQAYLKASNTGWRDLFGYNVALSEDTVVVGAFGEDSSTTGINSTPNDSASGSGAAYIFTGFGPSEIGVEAPTGTEVESGVATLAFDHTGPGHSDDLVVTIRNDGGADLSGILATITGSDALEFELFTTPPASLFGGESAEFTLRFSPASLGVKSATLSIASDDADENPFTIALTGTGNTPPDFSAYAIATDVDVAADLSFAKMLFGVTDAEGHSFSVTAAGPASSLGGSVTLGATSLTYDPPLGISGTDTFQVTVTDSLGGAATGTVTVTIRPENGDGDSSTRNPVQLLMTPGGEAEIRFKGIPGRQYRIQRSIDMADWSDIATVNAAPNGEVHHLDPEPPSPSAFYRIAN